MSTKHAEPLEKPAETPQGLPFEPFQKIDRLKRGCVVTEKIDGTNDPKRIGHANALADSAEADVHALRRSHRAWQWIAAGSWAWAVGGMAMYVAILMGWWTP